MQKEIFIKGARENNLKNIDVTIPRDKLVVLTGLSGSGKSSLAFDTIYAEGQRRYVESLSSYARMFLGQMDKPDVDYIEGLSPAISIDQKTTSKNPRSTVGTVTEIYDYLRLLWARVGTPHCPHCGKEIRRQTVDQIIDQILALPEGTRIQVMAPVVRGRKGEHAKVLEDARRSGFVRARVDGNMYELSEDISLEKNLKHRIDIVVDRLIVRPDIAGRLTDSVETASNLANGLVTVNLLREERDITFSQNYACDDCGISIEELTPRLFSFNSPFGACPTCTGLGLQLKADPALIIPDGSKSILEGAITATGWASIRSDGISRMYFEALSKKYRFSLTQPYDSLSDEVKNIILYGTGGEKLELHYDQPRGKGVLYQAFEGICNNLERRYQETQSDASKKEIEGLMTPCPCPACQGKRLRPEALAVTVGGKSIYDATTLPVDDALAFFDHLDLTGNQQIIAAQILKEIHARLGFLQSVGLSYLTLSRASGTLSGGESQRIRLATQIGSSLMGVLYILVSLIVIFMNIRIFPGVIANIFRDAFNFKAAFSGFTGSCIMWGIKRGLYSNEAGVGSAPNAAAAADVSHPVKQGLVQMLSVFLDTLVICSATAFMLLCSGVEPAVELQGAPYVQSALAASFGTLGPVFITVAMVLFAFTTLIGNLYYVDNALAYLLGHVPSKRFMVVFRLIAMGLIFLGAGLTLDLVWNLSDVLMGVMVLINIPVIAVLSRPAAAALRNYTEQRRAGKNPVFRAADIDLKEKTEYWN